METHKHRNQTKPKLVKMELNNAEHVDMESQSGVSQPSVNYYQITEPEFDLP